jgi:four helix bundle protein
MQDYRKLKVHARAHANAIAVRKATYGFPRSGFADFKKQLTKAAESIPFNIVEGCGSESQLEFARFLQISIKSAFEVEYQLTLAKDYEVLPPQGWESLTKETIQIRKMLCGLRKRVLDIASEESDEPEEN